MAMLTEQEPVFLFRMNAHSLDYEVAIIPACNKVNMVLNSLDMMAQWSKE